MDSKFYVIAVACLIGGLAGGYLLGSNSTGSQVAAYQLQVQNLETALNASEAQNDVKDAAITAQDALIESQEAQIAAQTALVQAKDAEIQAKDAQIAELNAVVESQSEMISLMQTALGLS